jgi:hypothetical protein
MCCCSTEQNPQVAARFDCYCSGGSFQRRFISPEEEKQNLKNYSEQLKKEQEGVEKRLKEFEG